MLLKLSRYWGPLLIATGITGIGMIGNSYSQNTKSLESYYSALDKGHLPIVRGVVLTDDDHLRRAVITQLICQFTLDFTVIENRYGISFKDYFASELRRLVEFEDDGLLRVHKERIDVLPAGRLLIRNICMIFDHYLQRTPGRVFSKAI